VLVTRFPGPVLRARLPVSELPAPEELGPVPAALARLGAPAALALVPLLAHRDVDTRYFALLTAGRIPSAPLVAPVAQRVFDRHPVVASAARAALAAMRGQPGFPDALEKLRAILASRDSERATAAARALGMLHDVAAVDTLIELTEHQNRSLAQAAADALREICKQSLGLNRRRWASWWETNRDRPRAEWLIEALRHRDLDLRVSAIDELVRAVHDNFGYYADGPRQDREAAIGRWQEWWRTRGQAAVVL
jgi:HEAT repeat protein